ncbi:MAG: DUF3693 domain-containing protein [Rubrivivax sp.]
MVTIQELLSAAKTGAGIPSNYRLARVLGVSDNTVGNWQHGRAFPDDEMAARLAAMGHLDPGAVVASMHAQRASSEPQRALWSAMAKRLERAAVAACVVLSLGAWTGGPDGGALASTGDEAHASAPSGLYIMSTARRALRRLRDMLHTFTRGFVLIPA